VNRITVKRPMRGSVCKRKKFHGPLMGYILRPMGGQGWKNLGSFPL